MRLIDADALKDMWITVLTRCDSYRKGVLLEDIINAPTIDAVPTDFAERCLQIEIDKRMNMVEVVRCKECKYWQDNNGGYPHEECRWGKGETPDGDDFCSYGERRKP